MKYFKIALSLVFLLFVAVETTTAQKNWTQEADEAFEMNEYADAVDLYKKARSKVSNKLEKRRIYFQIAECYRYMNEISKAESAYSRTVRAKYDDPIVYLRYANILKIRGKFDEALANYKIYKERSPDDPRGQYGVESCTLAKQWVENPTRYEVSTNKRFNSRENDFSPSYADRKENSLVFTSSRENAVGRGEDSWTGEGFTDLFLITKDRKKQWSSAILFDEDKVINTAVNEGSTTFNAKASVVYFSRCPVEKKEKLGCQVYSSKKKGKGWGEPEMISIAGDSVVVVHPTISKDEKTMYFSSNLDGGYGGMDIWVVRRTSKRKDFGKPENLGPMVNTPGHEVFPFLREDNVLYFASDGLVGMGGLDLFRTEMLGSKWSSPENMKSPMNSSSDDFGIVFSKEGEQGFFSTNRKGGRGGDDVWSFVLPPLLYTLEGVVRDDNTLQLIKEAKITFKGSDGTNIESKTDDRGKYYFNNAQVLANTSYTIMVEKSGYLSPEKEGKISTVGVNQSKDFILNFNLVPIPPDPIVLPEIQYDLAKWDLKPQFQDSLNDLLATLEKNPRLVIELSAHTDFRDTDIKNDTLSQKRAQSVVDYLKDQGVDGGRLVAKGYGERQPRLLKKNTVTVGKYPGVRFDAGTHLTEDYINGLRSNKEKEAAHQLNRRTEFRILRDDFIPKTTIDTALVGKIDIVLNPDDDLVEFRYGPNNTDMFISCVINGTGSEFLLKPTAKEVTFSQAEIAKLLAESRITKDDFVNGAAAFNEDGTIKDLEKVIIEQFNLGTKMLEDVEVTIVDRQKEGIIAGDTFMNLIGTYKVSKEINSIIFN